MRWFVATAGVAGALGLAVGLTLGARLGQQGSGLGACSDEQSRSGTSLAPSVRQQVRALIERRPVRRAAELETYLAALEARARAQHQVTAFEVEPGVVLARELAGPERAQVFAKRMEDLAKDLAPRQNMGAEGPTQTTSATGPTPEGMFLGARIEAIKGVWGEAREEAIREYLRVVETAPFEERASAHAALNAAVGEPHAPPDQSTVDSLWHALGTATEPGERQELIREYVDLARQRPEEESSQRLTELNRRFGQPSPAP